jgi:predicted short-subunit dehydrogenase-like oxidoreductase (DUF2520 family)
LQSFARPAEAINNFRGTYCAYEGTPQALPTLRALIKNLGGIPLKINTAGKPLYHAAGVVASNYLVTSLAMAGEFIKASGCDKQNVLSVLIPLVEGTLKNIKQVGIPHALTGPIARGDIATIRNHLSTIKKHRKDFLPFYRILGKYTIKLAQAKGGISNRQARAFHKLFEPKNT